MDFIVVDTEGKDIVSEIAIVDSSGKLIVERFVEGDLEAILLEIQPLLEKHTIIAHYAKHDRKVLQNSYSSIGLSIKLKSICTVKKAQALLPDQESYALNILSSKLMLKHDGSFFDANFAHRASYDAAFTYLLYQKLCAIETSYTLAKTINPFSSSKVDNPFQEHFDDTELYASEFDNLLQLMDEIKHDSNRQSKTALVIGEAGNGKTHLMMRFFKRISDTNRFLFISKPNNKNTVLHHTYTKILESFVQKIDGSTYTQLEHLLAKSFSAIILRIAKNTKVKGVLKKNHFNIFERFGKDGTDAKNKNWKVIEKSMLQWYHETYGNDPLSVNLLKALIKYAFYTDDNKRDTVINYLSGRVLDDELVSGIGLEVCHNISLEEFSLKAISLFGKLSLFDEPLIISFDQLEAMSSDEALLLSFGESIKELLTATPNSLVILNLFPGRWREYEALFDGSFVDLVGKNKVILDRPSASSLKGMLKQRAGHCGIDLDVIFEDKHIYKDILKHNSIRKVLNRANDYFKLYVHGIELPKETIIRLEDKLMELMERVKHLESRQGIEQNTRNTKINFDAEKYIQKTYEQKLQDYSRKSIIDDKQDIDKLKHILTSISEIYDFNLDLFKTKKVLPEHIIIKTPHFHYVIAFMNLGGGKFANRIKNFNSLVANRAEYQFRLFRDSREAAIKGEISKNEITKLNNSKNGKFIRMYQKDRVVFETIYQLIVDLQNKDIDVPLESLLESIFQTHKEFWLCKLLDRS